MEYDPQEMFASGALLASRGIYCVRLYGVTDDFTCTCGKGAGCATPGKHPRGEGWQHLATVNEDEIAEWAFGEGASRWNLGARLGKQSGIIDVEVDGPEAQAELERWGLHLIDTPAYKASRGEHRWFAYQDDLPDVGVVKIGPLEVRIGGGGKASQLCLTHGMAAASSIDGSTVGPSTRFRLPRFRRSFWPRSRQTLAVVVGQGPSAKRSTTL